ncbi:MAG TPA: hypothetical protein PK718_08440 [Candidatus Methanofastidiosa archaeon]|nr:hypothetical protein [Candidatus Methanofastidiosa archaeon]
MISELETIEIIRSLENNDISKARDMVSAIKSPESSYERGYVHALRGLVASCENKEGDSVFQKLIKDLMPQSSINDEWEISKTLLSQNFRPSFDIGYEHAWEFIFSYFSGNVKTGLDKYQE